MLSFESKAAKKRPVSQVITLLEAMMKQLEKDAADDQEMYDKIACWCETNDKSKEKSIDDNESHRRDLLAKIAEYTAKSSQLTAEISALEKEIAANEEALNQALVLRQKQQAEFTSEEKDMLGAIAALEAAIAVLSKHHSLIQVPKRHLMGVFATLKIALNKHPGILQGVLTPSHRRIINAFIQSPEGYLDASLSLRQEYTPQSGTIYGIMEEMLDTFKANLAEAQKQEAEQQKAYQELKAAKEAEIAAGQDQLQAKRLELAEVNQKLAQAKQDLEDTESSITTDTTFQNMVKATCGNLDREFQARQQMRAEETQAVSQALSVLSSDDAHDLFTRTFNPAFLQVARDDSRRSKAAQILNSLAVRHQNPRLATLAERVRLDAFTNIKKAIDEMVVQLQKQQVDEVKEKDNCNAELASNQAETEKYTREEEDLVATIADLDLTIKTYGEEIDTLTGEIAELTKQLKIAGDERAAGAKESAETIADQRETQRLLKQATDVLSDFYGKAALLQRTKGKSVPPPAPGFGAYEKQGAGVGVIGMLQQIISDASVMEAEAIKDEEAAQKTYEDTVKETNASIAAKSKEITHKTTAKSEAEGQRVTAQEGLEAAKTQLTLLAQSKATLHAACDFLIANFEARQTARQEEIEALHQAKAILSGATI